MYKQILLALLFVATVCHAQERVDDKAVGFSMERPVNWEISEPGAALANAKEKLALDPAFINKLMEENKGVVEVVTFMKYATDKHNGVIPTVKVNLRSIPQMPTYRFKESIADSFRSFKSSFSDFTFIKEPEAIEVDGFYTVHAVFSYSLKTRVGVEKVKVWVYAIQRKNNFIQVSFMDGEKEDNSETYTRLVNTIRLTSSK